MDLKLPTPGTIVKSTQGRDEGRLYIVISVDKKGIYSLCDGNVRKIANPKRKQIKHLKVYPLCSEAIALRLKTGEKVYDSQIYSVLRRAAEELKAQSEEEQQQEE